MNMDDVSTTVSSSVFGDVNSNISSLFANDSYPLLNLTQDPRFENEGDENDELGSSALLPVRLAVIFCVLVGICLLAWGSYAIHQKRIRNNKNSKYHNPALLSE